jgi:hypothetical protein
MDPVRTVRPAQSPMARTEAKCERARCDVHSVKWKFLTAADLRSFAEAGAIVVLPVIGDARRAARDKGERLMAACRDGIAGVLRDPRSLS